MAIEGELELNKSNCDITNAELGTLLAALRFYQQAMRPGRRALPTWALEIATNGGEFDPLESDDIDELCEKLNVS